MKSFIRQLRKKLLENWKFLICIFLICILLLPMIYTIFYSLPSTDDFSVATNVSISSLFSDSVRYANQRFFSWTGLWVYMFIETFINPLIRFPLESYGIGIEMIILFSLFVISLFAAINTASRKILGITEKTTIAVYFLAFLFVFLNTNIYSEIYYWFVGSSYMMAMTLGLITIALTIRFFYNNKPTKREMILLSVIGALACNFFQEAILPGMVYVILWGSFSIKERKPLWKKSIPFWIMLLSGVIAVAAPGNYARHTSFSSDVNLLKAFFDAMIISVKILKHMIQQPLVIALLIMGIYIGIRHTCKTSKLTRIYIISIFLSLTTLVLNSFPIALGYAGAGYFPNRLYFVLDLVLLVGMLSSAICIGMYVKSIPAYEAFLKSGYVGISMAAFVFLLLYSTLVYGQNISKLPWSQTVVAMKDVKEIHDVWPECLIEIRDSEDSNVVVEIDKKYFDSPVLQLPRITGDAENWKNKATARLWGKESVVVLEKSE